jgi:DNA-binding protein H-NS
MSAVTNEQLESLSLTQLTQLESRIAPLIRQKHEEALTEARQRFATQLTQVAAQYGLKPAEIATPATGNGKTHKVKAKRTKRFAKKAPVIAKYRDPENAMRTWSGKGPAPGWMKQSGKPKEYFLAK